MRKDKKKDLKQIQTMKDNNKIMKDKDKKVKITVFNKTDRIIRRKNLSSTIRECIEYSFGLSKYFPNILAK